MRLLIEILISIVFGSPSGIVSGDLSGKLHGNGFIAQTKVVPVGRVSGQKNIAQRQRKKKNVGNGTKKNNVKQTGNTKKGNVTSKGSNGSAPKTSAEARKRHEETQKEIKLTEAQIKENDNKVSKGLADLGKLDVEIEATQTKIKELSGKVGNLEVEISTLETGISKNEEELVKLREEYLKAVRKMRVTKKNRSTLAFIFSSGSLSQALRRMRYLREFSAWRGRQTEEINGKITDLKHQKEALAKAKEEQQNALALQRSSEKILSAQHTKQEMLLTELRQNGKALESHLKRKQTEARELGNLVSQLIAEEQRKAAEEARQKAEAEAKQKAEEEARLVAMQEEEKNKNIKGEGNVVSSNKKETDKSTKKTSTTGKKEEKNRKPTEYADARKRRPRGKGTGGNVQNSSAEPKTEKSSEATGTTFESMRGKLPYPTTGSFAVTSRFGRQTLIDLPDVEYDNPGIDAETDAGASARAVYAGKVSGVYLLPGYNTVVIVNHGNYYTVYGNISSPKVKTGDKVDSGTSLGTLALNDEDNGHSSIHFEVWRNREKLNPQEWLR